MAPEYDIHTQGDLVIALTALFNFTRIRDGNIVDDYINRIEEEEGDIQPETMVPRASKGTAKGMDILRDKIAEDMWKDYQRFIEN